MRHSSGLYSLKKLKFLGIVDALEMFMMIALIVIGLTAVGLVIGLVAAANAPMGYEDATGFHYGPECAPARVEVAPAVQQPKFA